MAFCLLAVSYEMRKNMGVIPVPHVCEKLRFLSETGTLASELTH